MEQPLLESAFNQGTDIFYLSGNYKIDVSRKMSIALS